MAVVEWWSGRAKLRLSRFSLKAAILQEKGLARKVRKERGGVVE
jgi:hypothetical protein